MNICLLTCRAPFLIDEKVFPPLGLLLVGTALKDRGHNVSIRSGPDYACEYFGLGPTTAEYSYAKEMLGQIKTHNPGNRVVIGGPHALANPEECLADGFDVVVKGDGENITVKTFESSGVVDLGGGYIDSYCMADRSLLDIHGYRYFIDGKPATTIMTSRGCPYRCSFCVKTEGKLRYYSIDRVDMEIASLKARWGYEALMIFDDIFIFDMARAHGICRSLRSHRMLWRCFVRGDLVVRHGEAFVAMMAAHGCVSVGIGIESSTLR